MSSESEATLEKNLIAQLQENGYEYVNVKNEEQLKKNFKLQLEKLNNCKFSDKEFNRILTYLDSGAIFDKAKKLRDTYYVDRDKDSFFIKFLNTKEWCKNIFQVANQITVKGLHENRYDVTILINGLPLVQIELKRRGGNIKEAFNQVRYKSHSYSSLFNYIQIFVISNGINTKYFANGSKNDLNFEFTFFWKNKENVNYHSLDEFTDTFLEKCNIAKIISKYMVLNESSKTLMVLRAYQIYAVEAVLHQALDIKQNGYIWHTTGSGKTITSYKVSQLLAEDESIYKVIFVVDRRDLDIQTNKEFNSFCNGCVNETKHTGALIKHLTTDGNGKLVTTTIQKLSKAVKTKGDMKKLQDIRDKNIVLIYDECHRSQFGEMHKDIVNFFNNALSFGFTGTPIFAENANGNKTTKSIFGKKLHEYSIKDAIADNNVLGFSIDYFGGAKMLTEKDLEVKGIDKKEYFESDKRLNQIVDYIINAYDKKTKDREFNAMFTVARGGVIHKYYDLFKKKKDEGKHDLKVAAIFTYTTNEDLSDNKQLSRDRLDSYMDDYNEMFGTNFSTDGFKEYYVDVSKRMKSREIDLLLVVDMFLTGFDSKLLNTLFVDKNLQYHGLLQAFSRTNRIYNMRKSQGNIVCFRNLKENTDKAIRLFSDSNAIETIILPPYEYFVEKFNKAADKFYKLVKTVDEAVNLESENDKKNFVLNFRELLRILNKMNTFSEFSYDDINMSEQDFSDYKSVYQDFHDESKNSDKEKVSVLDDIDFELELLRNDKINVDYILNILKTMDPADSSFDHDKERILNIMKETEYLRSKISLIEKFIDEELGNINSKNLPFNETFDNFMSKEREEGINTIISDEDLNEIIARQIFDYYEYSGKLDEDKLKKSFNHKLKFKERRNKVKEVKNRIEEFHEKFDY
ncbi:restriction endonuclease subunit R [Methanobrevibacter sp. 87.7]|uniref:type I restriction endonuclease subunit R n=1 Tax=Methanobrevibacter sp. 87.7 TaxID=387957 RepID=UPI000B50CED8|nr:type I restriction endonuclease subunit R [Methanobrevibacter sp. 87.7]OWT32831.1 restriction endonuclease subunit R [Methanobrevibacter sp. 87.7]